MKGPQRRPVDPDSGVPIGPFEQPGYYPAFRSLEQRRFWDAATRAVVDERVEAVPPVRFFSADEAALLGAICDRVIPQDDRTVARRIPIVPAIDARLFDERYDGYRYADMPPDREAYRRGLAAIDGMARACDGVSFAALDVRRREELLRSLHDGMPLGDPASWRDLPVRRFWMLLVADCAEAYYAHPWAWDEIGFGGPAYPRGYVRLERGEPESWETVESRYAWRAPDDSLSDRYEPAGADERSGSPRQGGTH